MARLEDEDWVEETPQIGSCHQLTTHAYRRIPKRRPIGFDLSGKGNKMKEVPMLAEEAETLMLPLELPEHTSAPVTVTPEDRELLAREIMAWLPPSLNRDCLVDGARRGELLGYRKAVLHAIAKARRGF